MTRLASFVVDDRQTYGVVEDDAVRDVGAELDHRYTTLREVIAADAVGALIVAATTARAIPLDGVRWSTPILRPERILCAGLNYHDHRAESHSPAGVEPTIFLRLPSSLVAHEAPVVAPRLSDLFDYEGEVAVVIGRGGRHITVDDAMEHVVGLSILQDGSARDFQRHTSQFTAGKNFDASGSWGPWITTLDEIDDLGSVTLTTRLDGEVMQHAPLSDLITPIPELIEYCSRFTTLQPGDVIATGTPGGVGVARDPKVLLEPGNRLEVEVSGVGVLANTIVAEDGPGEARPVRPTG